MKKVGTWVLVLIVLALLVYALGGFNKVSNVVENAADAVVDTAGDAVDAVADVAEDAADAVGDAADAVVDTAGDAVDAVADVAEDAADAVGDAADAVADTAGDAVDAVADVAENAADVVEDVVDGDENEEEDTVAAVETNYIVFNTETTIPDDKKVAMFFHSKTCGSCAKLHEDITNNVSDIPDDVLVYQVDWDDNQDLAKEYGIAKYHTVRYVDSEENVAGLFSLDDILANL